MTIELLNQKLDEIRVKSHKGLLQNGLFGIKACKESILWQEKFMKQPLSHQYIELVQRGMHELGFNLNMIVACEELIFARGGQK